MGLHFPGAPRRDVAKRQGQDATKPSQVAVAHNLACLTKDVGRAGIPSLAHGIHRIANGVHALRRALEHVRELQLALQPLQGLVILANLGAQDDQLPCAHGPLGRATGDIHLEDELPVAAWTSRCDAWRGTVSRPCRASSVWAEAFEEATCPSSIIVAHESSWKEGAGGELRDCLKMEVIVGGFHIRQNTVLWLVENTPQEISPNGYLATGIVRCQYKHVHSACIVSNLIIQRFQGSGVKTHCIVFKDQISRGRFEPRFVNVKDRTRRKPRHAGIRA